MSPVVDNSQCNKSPDGSDRTMFCACSIMNSLVIVLFLSGMVAMIMLRTLHKDIARYNQMDSVVSDRLCANGSTSGSDQ